MWIVILNYNNYSTSSSLIQQTTYTYTILLLRLSIDFDDDCFSSVIM